MTVAESLIKTFKKTKTLPSIVTRLAELIKDENSTLQDFEEVIKLDPALVARLLTLVNSSYFGMARQVDSISRAVALLGMKNLHNIAITDAIRGMVDTNRRAVGFSPERLWSHSAATGICCKMIAERIFSMNGDDAYLCGILHDIGLIVEYEADRDAFLKIVEKLDQGGSNILAVEQEILGTDHCQIGYILAREWQIAETLAVAIRDHHLPNTIPQAQSATGILQMAEYIVTQLGISVRDGMTGSLAPKLTNHIQKNMAEYKVLAEDLP